MKNKASKKGNFWRSISFLILFYFIGQLLVKFFKKLVVKFNTQEREEGFEAEVEIQESEEEEKE